MKKRLSNNKALNQIVIQALKDNDGYCPCIVNSKGKEKYKCPCEDFRNSVKVGETCHCGLFVKEEL